MNHEISEPKKGTVQWDDIDVAYDRRQQRYIAYSIQTTIFGTGVCVQSAVDAYKNAYHELQESLTREHDSDDRRIGDYKMS